MHVSGLVHLKKYGKTLENIGAGYEIQAKKFEFHPIKSSFRKVKLMGYTIADDETIIGKEFLS